MGGGEDVIALYERAKPAMPRDPVFHRSLRDPALKAPLLKAALDLNYGFQ